MNHKNTIFELPYPRLTINFFDDYDSLNVADEFVGDHLHALGNVTQLRINSTDISINSTDEEIKNSFRETPKSVFGRFSFYLTTDEGYHCVLASPPDTGVVLTIHGIPEGDQTRDSYLRTFYELAQVYAQQAEVRFLAIRIQFSTASNGWVPDVPGSPSTDLVRLIRIPSSVRRSYPDPAVYWSAWDNQEAIGERVLLSRALDIDDVMEYRQSVYPRIWELARRAYPGQCTYYSPTFRNAEERALFNEGPQTIRLVGYNAELQIAEATCYVDDGQHIAPREILGLREALLDGQLPDGRPIKTIRVVFPSKEMAMQEGVPLLDVGVTVVYLDRQMQDQLLTAEDYTALA